MSQIEQRKKLIAQLEKFASGQWRMLAGGRELCDITEDRVVGLKRRVKKIDRSMAACRVPQCSFDGYSTKPTGRQ
jgi:hypothetical protein